jgi:hypothetical protein
MIRGYLTENVWQVMAELSFFFHQLCVKEIDPVVISSIEREAVVLLCKLEKIFPPDFFNPMQHLILHLPYEARMGALRSFDGVMQLRGSKKILEQNAKINHVLRQPS